MRFLSKLLVVVCIAYIGGAYTAIPANPEVEFWKQLMDARKRDIAGMRIQNPDKPIIFFTGGSSCAFSIDPGIVEDICGLPAFNLGLPVAAGNKYILHQALDQTQKGDILVVCLEPDTLSYANHYATTNLSFALSVLAGKPSDAAGGETFSGRISFREYLNLSRPGPRYLATWIGKTMAGRGYRYTPQDFRYHGRLQTAERGSDIQAAGSDPSIRLSSDGRELLVTFKKSAEVRGVRLIYSMPWQYTAEGCIAGNRNYKSLLMDDIRSIMPAIDDGFTGAIGEAAYFADTGWHLTARGSAIRSQALARALKAGIAEWQ